MLAAVHEWLESAVPWGTRDYSFNTTVPALSAARQRPLRTRSTPHLVKPVTVTKLCSRSQSAAMSPKSHTAASSGREMRPVRCGHHQPTRCGRSADAKVGKAEDTLISTFFLTWAVVMRLTSFCWGTGMWRTSLHTTSWRSRSLLPPARRWRTRTSTDRVSRPIPSREAWSEGRRWACTINVHAAMRAPFVCPPHHPGRPPPLFRSGMSQCVPPATHTERSLGSASAWSASAARQQGMRLTAHASRPYRAYTPAGKTAF